MIVTKNDSNLFQFLKKIKLFRAKIILLLKRKSLHVEACWVSWHCLKMPYRQNLANLALTAVHRQENALGQGLDQAPQLHTMS